MVLEHQIENIELHAIDCTVDTIVCDKWGVVSFPRISMYYLRNDTVRTIPFTEEINVRNLARFASQGSSDVDALKERSLQHAIISSKLQVWR